MEMQEKNQKENPEKEAVKFALDKLTAELWENKIYSSGTQVARQISNLCASYKPMYPDLVEQYADEVKQWRTQMMKTRKEELF